MKNLVFLTLFACNINAFAEGVKPKKIVICSPEWEGYTVVTDNIIVGKPIGCQ